MGWFSVFSGIAKKLLANKSDIEKVVKESADVWIAYKQAKADGSITLDEWVKIGQEAYESGEACYELAKKMGWRQ